MFLPTPTLFNCEQINTTRKSHLIQQTTPTVLTGVFVPFCLSRCLEICWSNYQVFVVNRAESTSISEYLQWYVQCLTHKQCKVPSITTGVNEHVLLISSANLGLSLTHCCCCCCYWYVVVSVMKNHIIKFENVICNISLEDWQCNSLTVSLLFVYV